jgi:hypothetical protein
MLPETRRTAVPHLTDYEYTALERFIRKAVQRVEQGKMSAASAVEDIMYPITSWDRENETEFVPWMKLRSAEWDSRDS